MIVDDEPALEGFQTQIADVRERAKREGRLDQVKFALNGFVIARATEAEAIDVLQEIQGKANKEAVEAFGDAVKSAGASTENKTGMWANSKVIKTKLNDICNPLIP